MGLNCGDLISARQAGEMIGKTQRWANELLRSGQIDGQLVDGRWITTRTAVEEYKRKSEPDPNQQGSSK